jgi:hypothetical protein
MYLATGGPSTKNKGRDAQRNKRKLDLRLLRENFRNMTPVVYLNAVVGLEGLDLALIFFQHILALPSEKKGSHCL